MILPYSQTATTYPGVYAGVGQTPCRTCIVALRTHYELVTAIANLVPVQTEKVFTCKKRRSKSKNWEIHFKVNSVWKHISLVTYATGLSNMVAKLSSTITMPTAVAMESHAV